MNDLVYPNDFVNKIICGDCLEVMKDIPDKSIDMILCDLPYGTTINKWDTVIPFIDLWNFYKRIIKKHGAILLFATGLFAYNLGLSNQKMYKYDLIWKKSKCGSPLSARHVPMKKHELILVFGNGKITYNPQMTRGNPYSRKSTPIKLNNMGYGISKVETSNNGTRYPISVLDFPQQWRRQDQIHPTQKPVPLFEYLIKTYSNEGDMILDNCIGSGTTAIACKNTNRNFIGIDISPEYCEIARQRLNE